MDKKDLASQAERYKQEMLRLYRKNPVPKPEPVPVHETISEPEPIQIAEPEPAPEIIPEPEPIPEIIPDTEDERLPEPADENSDSEEIPDALYPEPDISETEYDYPDSDEEDFSRQGYSAEESLGDSSGFIQVNVRTGDQSEPVVNASVEVSAIIGGKRLLIASASTDESGMAPMFNVPAPSASFSQSPNPDSRPYSLYDISVTASGFFNARSVDIPVFSGITSVQTFSMIPVPLFINPSSETVTYYNQEPNS